MTIQWQVLSARVNKLIIYVTMYKQKAPINMLSCSKAPKTQKKCGYIHAGKTGGFFNDFAIILLTWVSLQKFVFLLNVQFLQKLLSKFRSCFINEDEWTITNFKELFMLYVIMLVIHLFKTYTWEDDCNIIVTLL